jgi:hypothetical protein
VRKLYAWQQLNTSSMRTHEGGAWRPEGMENFGLPIESLLNIIILVSGLLVLLAEDFSVVLYKVRAELRPMQINRAGMCTL